MENIYYGIAGAIGLYILYRMSINEYVIFEYERGLKYRKGKFIEILEPGSNWEFFRNSLIKKVDIRPCLLTIAGQEVLTSDGVAVKVSIIANYKIVDPVIAINEVQDYKESVYT